MSSVVFAKTRHEYHPYRDFWRLVELSGFATCYLDEVDWSKDQTVIATPHNGEWHGIPVRKRTRLIHWNLERCKPDAPAGDMSRPDHYPYVDEMWVSDRAMADYVGAKYVFLGGHRSVGTIDVLNRKYDVISLMYISGRRQGLIPQLAGLTRADADGNLWGDERHKKLSQSRLMVTAHQDDLPWCEPIRFAVAGMYGLPILSETCADAGYWNGVITAVPFNELGAKARHMLSDDVCLARKGATAWRLVCTDRPFRQEVERAL